MRRIAELALGVTTVALLVLLMVPWKAATLPGITAGASSGTLPREAERYEPRNVVPPETILRLFTGGGPPAPAREALLPSPAAQPIDASWLRYMGRSSAQDGKTHVYVKDTISGKVIRATRAEALNGWILVSEDASGLLLQHGDDLYAVSKR
jgi:hypothetical protein